MLVFSKIVSNPNTKKLVLNKNIRDVKKIIFGVN